MGPIRVLHILHSMNRGGAENAIMNYYRHIDREKVQFDFLLTENNKCQFEDEIINLGGRVYRVPRLTISNPIPYLKAIRRFYKSHSEYSIVHSHTSSKSFFPLYLARKAGIPIRICHSHNNRSEDGFRGLIRDYLKYPLSRVSTHFMACSIDAAKWLYGKNVKDDVIYVPNVVQTQLFQFNSQYRSSIRSYYGIKDSTFVIGCTARFSIQKNHVFLLSIFESFHLEFPDSVLLLVGDGELREEIEKIINKLSLSDSVVLTGVVPDPGIYYSAMDVFVLPSLYEGLGMVLIEAQVSGLNCLTSESVAHEVDKTGLVSFIPLSAGPKYWADRISEVKAKGGERISRLKDIVAAGYDAEMTAVFLEHLYLELSSGLQDS